MQDHFISEIESFSLPRSGPLGEKLPAINQSVRELALKVIEVALDSSAGGPLIYQVSKGRLKLEYSNSKKGLELICRPDGMIAYRRYDRRDGKHETYHKGRFPGTELERLKKCFAWWERDEPTMT